MMHMVAKMSNQRKSQILVVEDDAKVRRLLKTGFEEEGFEVVEAATADEMRARLAERDVDVISLDLGLPGEDGLSVTRSLRATSDVPLVIITGKNDTLDTVLGLELGADDYIPKPFHMREVVARVRAVLRRREAAQRRAGARETSGEEIIAFDGWVVDLTRREVRRRDGEVRDLTGGEFDLLRMFVTHPNRVLTRDQIMDALKGRAWSPYDRAIDMQVRRLRQKIEADPAHPRHIKTVRGAGYMFSAAVEAHRAGPRMA